MQAVPPYKHFRSRAHMTADCVVGCPADSELLYMTIEQRNTAVRAKYLPVRTGAESGRRLAWPNLSWTACRFRLIVFGSFLADALQDTPIRAAIAKRAFEMQYSLLLIRKRT